MQEKMDERQDYLQNLLHKITSTYLPSGYHFKVHLTNDKMPNAFALPGGSIVITSGLLDMLDSENGTIFVIGHEIGHFKHRDHLRGLGSGLAVMLLQTMIGIDLSEKFIANISNITNLAYSRKDESRADLMGLDILYAVYGHAGGADEFFQAIKREYSDTNQYRM